MLLLNELKKLWTQRFMKWLCIASVLMSLVLLYVSYSTIHGSGNIEDYISLKRLYDKQDRMVVLTELETTLETLTLYLDYEQYQAIPDTLPELKEPYYHDIFHSETFITGYETYITDNDPETQLEQSTLLYSYYQSLTQYPEFVTQTITTIENLKVQPFWENYSTQRKVYFDELMKCYQRLEGTSLPSVNTISFELPIQSHLEIGLLGVGVMIFLSSFEIERISGMQDLLRIQENGSTKTTWAKIVASTLSFLAVFIGSYTIQFITSQLLYGAIDWQAPIQSIPTLYHSSYSMSIASWTTWILLGQLLGLLSLSLLITALYCRFKIRVHAYLLFVGLVGLSAALYFIIDDASVLVLFRYLNLFSITQTQSIIHSYTIVAFFNRVVPISDFITGIGILISSASLIAMFIREPTQEEARFTFKFQIPSLRNRLIKHLSHGGFECFKLMVMQRGWVIIGVLLFISGYNAITLNNNQSIRTQNAALVELYKTYGGSLDESKRTMIENQAEHYTQLETKLRNAAKAYQNHEITLEAYYQEIDTYSSYSTNRVAFNTFYDHYARNQSSTLIYPNGYQALFSMNTETRDHRNALLVMLVLIQLLATVFAQEQESDPDGLYRITMHGNKTLTKSKLKLAYGIAVGIVTWIYLTDLGIFTTLYKMDAWHAPLVSVYSENINGNQIPLWIVNLRLWQYALLIWVLRCSAALALSSVVLWISTRSQTSLKASISAFTLFFLPLILSYFGNSFLNVLSVHKVLMGHTVIYNGMNFWEVGLYSLIFAGMTGSIIRHSQSI